MWKKSEAQNTWNDTRSKTSLRQIWERSSSSSRHQTSVFHLSTHFLAVSLNLLRLSNEQGCARRVHCTMCAVFVHGLSNPLAKRSSRLTVALCGISCSLLSHALHRITLGGNWQLMHQTDTACAWFVCHSQEGLCKLYPHYPASPEAQTPIYFLETSHATPQHGWRSASSMREILSPIQDQNKH